MRIKTLDAFRGLAAISVLLFHYTTRYDQIFDSNFILSFWFGWLGVPVFFILSGFVIHLTIDRSKDFKEFLKKRFYRLYPTFWISIIITLIFIYFSTLKNYTRFSLDKVDIIMNFTMFHQFFGFKHIDGAYWSLLPELLFYLLMAFLMVLGFLKRFYLVNSFLLALCTIHFFHPLRIVGKILDLDYVLLFFIGICFYRLKNNTSLKLEHFFIILNLIIASFLYQKVQPSNSLYIILFSFTVIVVVYYLFLYDKLRWMGNIKLLIFLGNISYALYLVHQNIGYVIINIFENKYDLRFVGIFVATGFSILVAYVITYYLEPILRNNLRKAFNFKYSKKING